MAKDSLSALAYPWLALHFETNKCVRVCVTWAEHTTHGGIGCLVQRDFENHSVGELCPQTPQIGRRKSLVRLWHAFDIGTYIWAHGRCRLLLLGYLRTVNFRTCAQGQPVLQIRDLFCRQLLVYRHQLPPTLNSLLGKIIPPCFCANVSSIFVPTSRPLAYEESFESFLHRGLAAPTCSALDHI